jgi:methionine-S-sulfoxide reductase
MEQIIYLAGGCFWGVQAYFKQLQGVKDTMVGYANGNMAFPAYEDLKEGRATHAETVKVVYEDTEISLEKLLEHYLRFVDPYSHDQQGHDIGHQYRAGVYYTNMMDGIRADAYFTDHLKEGWTIEIKQMENFYPAEEYHQDYLDKNPGGYCHVNLGLIKPNEKKHRS